MPKFIGIRNVLNRVCWHPNENKEDYEIFFIHRGAPNDLRSISAKTIVRVRKQSFEYKENDGSMIYIPFHRIVMIRNIKTKEVIWRSKSKVYF